MVDIKEIISSYKAPSEEFLTVVKDLTEFTKKFHNNAKAWEETKNKHYLVLADDCSQHVIADLFKIIEIAERTKNQNLKQLATSFMNDILIIRKGLGLKS